MATEPRNILYRGRQMLDVKSLPIKDNAGTLEALNEGDLLILDAGVVSPLSNPDDAVKLVGFSQTTNPVRYHGDVKPPCASVYIGRCTVKLIAAEAGAFVPGTPVYGAGAGNAQSFVLTQPGAAEPIGKIWVEAVEYNGVASGNTVLGQQYEIMLRESVAFA